MSQFVDGNTKGFTAGEALNAFCRVKLSAAGTVSYADAGEDWIGTTEAAAASGAHVDVRLRNAAGTRKMLCAGAITYNDIVYGADDGEIDDAPTGPPVGRALETATADGDIIEVLTAVDVSEATGGIVEVTAGSGGIAANDLVYVSDQTGGVMTVLKAQATSGGYFADFICPNAIAEGATGIALKVFLLQGIDTDSESVGDPIYLSDGTAGGYTATKPTSTDKVQIVGYVREDSATTGAILFDTSGPQQIVHTHVDNSEGGQLSGIDAVASASIGGTSDIADLAIVEAAGSGAKIARADHAHALANVANVTEGVPFVINAVVSASGAEDETVLASAQRKFKVIRAWMISRDTNAVNVTLKNATNAFTSATAKGATDDAVVEFDIIAEQDEVAASAAVVATFSGAGAVDVCLLCIPIA